MAERRKRIADMSRILARLASFNFFGVAVDLRGRLAVALRAAAWRSSDDPTYLIHFSARPVRGASDTGSALPDFHLLSGHGPLGQGGSDGLSDTGRALPRLTRDLKRRTFPVALLAMLVPIATAAAGTAAPASGMALEESTPPGRRRSARQPVGVRRRVSQCVDQRRRHRRSDARSRSHPRRTRLGEQCRGDPTGAHEE